MKEAKRVTENNYTKNDLNQYKNAYIIHRPTLRK